MDYEKKECFPLVVAYDEKIGGGIFDTVDRLKKNMLNKQKQKVSTQWDLNPQSLAP